MSNFETQITFTKTGTTQGYNHVRNTYDVHVTTYGVGEMHEQVQAKFTRVIKSMLESDGVAGCYRTDVEGVFLDGLVGRVDQPNPYNADSPYEYGTYRFRVQTYTSGSD